MTRTTGGQCARSLTGVGRTAHSPEVRPGQLASKNPEIPPTVALIPSSVDPMRAGKCRRCAAATVAPACTSR